jgi:hypothetical protein
MTPKTRCVESLDEAIVLLEEIRETSLDIEWDIKFGDLFAQVEIDIEGRNYHSTVPAELARGLWEFQEALYKAVAFALYGVEDGRRLTRPQREQFELIFSVSKGSTQLSASIKELLSGLATAFETMESKHKAGTLVAIAVVLVVGYGAVQLLDNKPVQIEQIKASLAATQEAEKTRQFKIVAEAAGEATVVSFAKASEKGSRAIVESARDADKIKIGRVRMGRSEIDEVTQRAARDRATATIVVESFTVLRVEPKEGSLTRFLLQRPDGTEFLAILQDDELDAADVQLIWDAARSRKLIELEITLTTMRNAIRSATILRPVSASTPRLPPARVGDR